MRYWTICILAIFALITAAPCTAVALMIDCNAGPQNISPPDMGALQTFGVISGSHIQLDGAEWRDGVNGKVPPVGFPGVSIANVTNGSHSLKITRDGYQDFVATVNICRREISEVKVSQAAVGDVTAPTGSAPLTVPPRASGAVMVPGTIKAPGIVLSAPAATSRTSHEEAGGEIVPESPGTTATPVPTRAPGFGLPAIITALAVLFISRYNRFR